MATDVSRGEVSSRPVSPDVTGGAVGCALALLHLFVLQLGGALGFVVLLVAWPLVGGTVAARLSHAEKRRVAGTLAGTFGALFTTVAVLLTGYAGAWPTFVTTNFGVAVWSVTFSVLLTLLLSWTVFGFLAGYVAERA